MQRRAGFSLIEVLVVVAILGVLIGLILPAIQQVRAAAGRTRESNKLRQFALAAHSFADAHAGHLPNAEGLPPNQGDSVMSALSPYMDFGDLMLRYGAKYWRPSQIRSEADPSFGPSGLGVPGTRYHTGLLGDPTEQTGDTSYAFNALVFAPGATLVGTIKDGTSQTIGITHHYARCNNTAFEWFMANPMCYAPTASGGVEQVPCWTRTTVYTHASTFADAEMGDALPYGISTRPNLGTATFQVRPRLADCDFRVPQALFPNGLMVAMLDGSVRTVNPNVSAGTFWAAVTPDGGEVLGD